MRKPNIELKRINFKKVQLQAVGFLNRITDLQDKLEVLKEKHAAKVDQMETLRHELAQLEAEQNATTQNEIPYPLGTPSNLQ